MRIAHKAGEPVKKKAITDPEVQEFINMFIADHNSKFHKKSSRANRSLITKSVAR